MTDQKTTSVEDLLCRIASRQRIADECRDAESRIASSRNSAETEAMNAVVSLAVELRDALGEAMALRLAAELAKLTGWRPAP